MRSVTKKALLGLAVVVVILLALGALPSFLKSGDPYYLTATPTNETLAGENATMPDAANLSERSYRYTWQALNDVPPSPIDGERVGRSQPYWRGPTGFKEAFSHSPFDELDGLRVRYSAAFVGNDSVLVRWENQTYRLALTQAPA